MTGHRDPTERRTQLADAAIEVAACDGLDAVTVARVAARAGVSVGLVQHHFPAKRGLMTSAYERTLDLAFIRVAEHVERGERAHESIRSMVVQALSELLPLDEGRRAECLVRAQFAGRAIAEPELAEVWRRAATDAQARLAQVVRNGRQCAETAADIDAEHAAWRLWALLDGLGLALVHEVAVPALEVLDEAVRLVFPNPCQRSAASLEK